MKVTVDKIGGFVGFSRFQVNSDDLSHQDQLRLLSLVEKIRAVRKQNTPLKTLGNESVVQVVVESHEGAYMIPAAPETGASKELDDLIQFVEMHGKPQGLDD